MYIEKTTSATAADALDLGRGLWVGLQLEALGLREWDDDQTVKW